jgi:hypothetical protein
MLQAEKSRFIYLRKACLHVKSIGERQRNGPELLRGRSFNGIIAHHVASGPRGPERTAAMRSDVGDYYLYLMRIMV